MVGVHLVRMQNCRFSVSLKRAAVAALQVVSLVALSLAGSMARTQELQPVPTLSGRVVDLIDLLQPEQRSVLDVKLATFEAQTGTQIVVLLIGTTHPEDAADYARRVGNTWKIGRRDVGDGLLLVVARDDRTIRIEVAKTLEGAVPDLAAKQIIDQTITPAFRRGDYAEGLNAGVDRLIARVRGEHLPLRGFASAAKSEFDVEELLAIAAALTFFVVIFAMLGGLLFHHAGKVAGSLGIALVFGLPTALFVGASNKYGFVIPAIGILAAVLTWALASAVERILYSARWDIGSEDSPINQSMKAMAASSAVNVSDSSVSVDRSGNTTGDGFSSGGGGDFGGGGASGRW